MPEHGSPAQRRWRDYRTGSGRSPVKGFIMNLPIDGRIQVAAAMKDVRDRVNSVAHHLRGDIYEVRARTATRQLRILYATEGRSDQILLALHAIVKSTRAVPDHDIALAARRLQDWRSRGQTS